MINPDFYPTPRPLIEKLLDGINLREIGSVLEPSAGKGDICDYVAARAPKDYHTGRSKAEIDVCETDEDLQHILTGKGYRLVCDDFLELATLKPYDLIVANFPFSQGERHLRHALRMLERSGGELRAIVNAETVRNPYTLIRTETIALLEKLGATWEFMPGEFLQAERRTDVEIALVKCKVELSKANSVVLDGMRKAIEREAAEDQREHPAALVAADFKTAMIARFNLECRAGVALIDEYQALRPHILSRLPEPDERTYISRPLITLLVDRGNGNSSSGESRQGLVNTYLQGMREKYWAALLRDRRFRNNYTSNITDELERRLKELREYDFNAFNIAELEKDLCKRVTAGIEKAILDLFDKLSSKYAYNEDIHNGNVHYYSGWKTNKAWKINKKVVLPMYLLEQQWSGGSKFKYQAHDTLTDIMKVFNYLAAGERRVAASHWIGTRIQESNDSQKFQGIDCAYFDLNVYKKGTVHLKFKDQRLLDKLNIFGSQRKAWLPPAYGKKAYEEMTREEQAVIDDFQGREAYAEVLKEKEYYLVEAKQLMLAGEVGADA